MKAILDTHAFLWIIIGDRRTKSHWREIEEDKLNELYLSIASLWEIAIKISIKKLTIPFSMEELIENYIIGGDVRILWISPKHISEVVKLPFHHRDPFDRMIRAQSIVENIPIVTADPKFKLYDVDLV